MSEEKNYHMTPEALRKYGRAVVDWIADYYEKIESLPVLSQVEPGELRSLLPAQAPKESEAFGNLLNQPMGRFNRSGDLSSLIPGCTTSSRCAFVSGRQTANSGTSNMPGRESRMLPLKSNQIRQASRNFYIFIIQFSIIKRMIFSKPWNDGMMEWWNDGMMVFQRILSIFIFASKTNIASNPILQCPEPNFPVFHHSSIPIWGKSPNSIYLYFEGEQDD